MYTDGMSEAMDAGRRMYGDDRVVEAAAALPRTHTARESVEALLADLRGFLDGVEPQDDVTLMVLRVRDEVVPAAPPAGAPA
jgi:serine phosphatase RsbU (regulator of sigma subunit)